MRLEIFFCHIYHYTYDCIIINQRIRIKSVSNWQLFNVCSGYRYLLYFPLQITTYVVIVQILIQKDSQFIMQQEDLIITITNQGYFFRKRKQQ
ncbi:unnamed protein product [Paramecium octaurelia]|uniref:Transmembrane protein n=1 Tax=Paramecium octaurelia TaxID=43137 RepID=A0A8S1WDJ1_PAROT|nr:unnamed protein product [Paramecium octaurelia]